MTEAVTKTIVGSCEEISEKNGWTTFHVNVGTQYPVKLSTKLPAMIEAGRAVGTDTATWTYKESDGNENPNKPARTTRTAIRQGGGRGAPGGRR